VGSLSPSNSNNLHDGELYISIYDHLSMWINI